MTSALQPPIYLSTHDLVRIVQKKGLSVCIEGIADRIEDEFRRWETFDKSARVGAHCDEGVIELMPVANEHQFSFKCVNGHPCNTAEGLPTVMAFGVLADMATGLPRLFTEMTITTAMRTAAMSAVAARALCRKESRSMALIGNGAQSEFQAIAFRDLVGIRELRLYDVDPKATAKLAANLASQGLRLIVCDSVAEAAHGADILTTVTAAKNHGNVVTARMIRPGMHLNAVGGDCPGKTELHRDVVAQSSVFVEFEPQTRIEGEIQQMAPDFPVTELWQVLAGRKPGRTSASEVTLFDSVGFALEDFCALTWLKDTAEELGIGDVLDFVPGMSDPKDLFGALRLRPARAGRVPLTHGELAEASA